MAQLVNRVKSTLQPNDHPYRNGAWTPNYEEYDADDLTVRFFAPHRAQRRKRSPFCQSRPCCPNRQR